MEIICWFDDFLYELLFMTCDVVFSEFVFGVVTKFYSACHLPNETLLLPKDLVQDRSEWKNRIYVVDPSTVGTTI